MRLTSSTRCQASSEVSARGARCSIPALSTSPSRPPRVSRTCDARTAGASARASRSTAAQSRSCGRWRAPGALLAQERRDRRADTAGGAGHQDPSSGVHRDRPRLRCRASTERSSSGRRGWCQPGRGRTALGPGRAAEQHLGAWRPGALRSRAGRRAPQPVGAVGRDLQVDVVVAGRDGEHLVDPGPAARDCDEHELGVAAGKRSITSGPLRCTRPVRAEVLAAVHPYRQRCARCA